MQIACRWHISDRLHLWSLQSAWVSHAQNCSITTQKTQNTTWCGPPWSVASLIGCISDGAPCWPDPSLIQPSLMWSGHAITLPALAFTNGHACTQTVWVTLIGMTCQQVHMWLACTPHQCTACPLHVCPANLMRTSLQSIWPLRYTCLILLLDHLYDV